MNPHKNTVKNRIILGLGDLQKIERPRELQHYAGTNEHHIVHELYQMEKQNLVSYKIKRNVHSAGKNLTGIHLTPKGKDIYREIKGG